MKYRTAELGTGIFFLIFSAVYLFYLTPNFITDPMRDAERQKIAWTLRPEMLPHVTIGLFAVASLGVIIHALRSNDDKLLDFELGVFLKVAVIVCLSFIYVKLLSVLGFLVITPLFLEVSFYQLFQLILPEGKIWN